MGLKSAKAKNIQYLYQLLLKKHIQKIRTFQSPITYLGLIILIFIIFTIFPKPPCAEQGVFFSDNYLEKQNLFFEQKEPAIIDYYEPVVLAGNSFKQALPTTIYQAQSFGSFASIVEQRQEIIEYIVQTGDTLSLIAEKFNISLNTVLWANDLSKNSRISPGKKLTILPVSGVMHLVDKGETLSGLAAKYKVDTDEIIDVNNIFDEGKIFRGDILIIPGGKPPPKPVIQYAPLANSYFICPVSSFRITQGLHWYNAIDFGSACGNAVFASAGGTVQRTGYDSMAGNYVRVLHPNGVVTFYGHLSAILAAPGQQVSQGTIIGHVGNTGHTIGPTGCHVHFEVRGARNPFTY